jgi:hypothetical protein
MTVAAEMLEDGWVVNTGEMPVSGNTKVDTIWKGSCSEYNDYAARWSWDTEELTHWRLHNAACGKPPKSLEDAYDHLNTRNIFTDKPITMTAAEYINSVNVLVEQPLGLPLSRVCKAFEAITGHPISEEHAEVFVELLKICK